MITLLFPLWEGPWSLFLVALAALMETLALKRILRQVSILSALIFCWFLHLLHWDRKKKPKIPFKVFNPAGTWCSPPAETRNHQTDKMSFSTFKTSGKKIKKPTRMSCRSDENVGKSLSSQNFTEAPARTFSFPNPPEIGNPE